MFRKGGIFAGLGETPAPTLQNLMIPLDPAAGKGVPFTSMLQSYLKTTGNKNLVVDGQWGQCSHSAFTKNLGVAPSADAIVTLFQLDKFGVPASNVQVWQPKGDQTCYSKTDTYEPPPVEQQLAAPEPALLLAKLFGVTPPANICPMPNQVPDMATSRCGCKSGYYQNPNTGECVQVEGPGTMGGGGTTTGGSNTTTSTGTRLIRMTNAPKFQLVSAQPSTQQVKPGTTTLKPGLIGGGLQRISAPSMQVMPGRLPGGVAPAIPTGMSTGAKVALGVVALGVVGVAAWLVLRKKDDAGMPEITPNCGYRRNCGWRPNCGE